MLEIFRSLKFCYLLFGLIGHFDKALFIHIIGWVNHHTHLSHVLYSVIGKLKTSSLIKRFESDIYMPANLWNKFFNCATGVWNQRNAMVDIVAYYYEIKGGYSKCLAFYTCNGIMWRQIMLFSLILAQIQENYVEVDERQQYSHNSSSTKNPQNFPQLHFLLLATQIGELNRLHK